MQRDYDKINYQTNFTATTTFALLLKAVKDNEPIDSEKARATIFPQVRSASGMRWSSTSRDTHGEISLDQYGLIEYVTKKTFKLSPLGERFLELFETEDITNIRIKKDNDYNYVSTMIDCFFAWNDNKNGRKLNIGVLLFSLLDDNRLDNYITDEDWAYVCTHSNIKKIEEYNDLVTKILYNRKNNKHFELKKTDIFLGGMAGTWKILEKDNNKYKLSDLSKAIIKEKIKLFTSINDFQIDNNDKYFRFKKLLSWFTRQLNINNDLEEGTKTSGKGDTGASIQQKYSEWRDYIDFTLDCTIQSGYMGTSSKVNYIHKSCTGINIRPYFDKTSKEIKYLYIDLYNNTITLSERVSQILEKEYKLDDLCLFDDQEPNLLVQELFDDFSIVVDELSFIYDEDVEEYSKDSFLDDAFMDSDSYDKLFQLLMYKKNVILQGAPGVGKTFLATRLAYSIIGNKNRNQVEMIQFHQSYSYEDFIMGFKPNETGFELQNGIFYDFCKKAKDNPQIDFFFIIDEINRGNLSKIFGELLMLVEGDKRGSEHSIKLAYKNELFYVPKNVYIIGMMNTADRSLGLMDYALRRRFSFYEINPAFDNEKFKNHISEYIGNETIVDNIIKRMKDLNSYISNDDSSGLGRGFRIGHSYFCIPPVEGQSDEDWYASIINFEVLPLLEEYWWDEKTKVDTWKNKLLGE